MYLRKECDFKMRRNRKLKKAAAILTAGMMITSAGTLFSGCGKNNDSSSSGIDKQELVKSLSYDVQELNVIDGINGNIISKNGLLYANAYTYDIVDEMYYSKNYIIVFDTSGTIKTSIPVFIQTDGNEYGYVNGNINVDDAGNISVMLVINKYDPETGEDNGTTKFITYDPTGKEIASVDMKNVVTAEDNEAGMYFSGYVVDKSGNIFVNLGTCVRVIDPTGKVLFTTPAMENENSWINTLITTNTGAPAIVVNEYTEDKSSVVIKEIDVTTQGYGAEHIIPGNYYSFYPGTGDYLCYTTSDTGIVGFKSSDMKAETVLNLLNLGVDNSQINSFTICDDGSFITTGYNYSGNSSSCEINFIKPIESSEVKEKQVITIGCFSLDWNVRSAIADFNKTNENYTIYCDSYSDTNDTSDYTAALTKFNNEILAGNVPDILLINSQMPYDSYASKGLFTDLYTMIDNDPELNREAFMPNVLKAMETDGKLYEMAANFYIQTYAAKKSIVGDVNSITMDKANELLASMPEGAELVSGYNTRSNFISEALCYSDFVDYKNATCSFDTPEFKAILEAAKAYPAEIDYDSLYNENPNYWMDMETACRDDRALLSNAYFYDFDSYNRLKQAQIGEDISMVGFPGMTTDPERNGSVISFSIEMAISEKSDCKEAAWEFIKEIVNEAVTLEDVYQYNASAEEENKVSFEVGSSILAENDETESENKRYTSNYYGLPVLVSQMNQLAEEAQKPLTYIDENGNTVEQENIYYVGNEEIKIKTMTKADTDEFINYIKTVDRKYTYDENLFKIIDEDTAAFFNGTKTADETAAMIQSRASIYLSEQY